MEDVKQLSLPKVPEAFMRGADVLLVLDDGVGIPCHSQILSMHSTVICNMLSDLASHDNEKVKVPLAEFTAEQCLLLLAYLYQNGTSYKGPAFERHETSDLDAAVAVARFAHAYDARHALQHVEAYLRDFMDAHYKPKKTGGMPKHVRTERLSYNEIRATRLCWNGRSWPRSLKCMSFTTSASEPL